MFKIKNYIITPIDLYRGVLHLVKKAGPKDIVGLVVLIVLFCIFKYHLDWQTDSSLFMIFWIALFYWHLDSRISIVGALVCLVFCPILLILENNYGFLMGEIWAEQSAVWAYYFLVIGVTKQVWEFRKEEKEKIKKDDQKLDQVENAELVEEIIQTGDVNESSKQEELVTNQFSQKNVTDVTSIDSITVMRKEVMREKVDTKNLENVKTIDEIIEEVRYKQNEQNKSVVKQRRMMDVRRRNKLES